MDPEKQYAEELKANGVDLPELEEVAADPKEPEKEPETPATPEEEEETEGDEPEDKPQPVDDKPKKRSIYHEYKEVKSDLKSERQAREEAEKQRDELQKKLDAVSEAKKDEKQSLDVEEDAIAYAEKIGADPDLVKQIIADARKGIKTELDPAIAESLARFNKWESENRQQIEKQAFEKEFTQVTPVIKEFFPSISEQELKVVKENLDKLSHSKEWHDKDLEYIVFKNRDSLADFVSPKKRGVESREKKDVQIDTFDFDPTADLSSMTPAERDKWETQYRNASRNDGLMTSRDGKKFII